MHNTEKRELLLTLTFCIRPLQNEKFLEDTSRLPGIKLYKNYKTDVSCFYRVLGYYQECRSVIGYATRYFLL